MKFIASREFANPAKALAQVERAGYALLTNNGKPRAIVLPTSEDRFEVDLRQALAYRSAQSMVLSQFRAEKSGRARMTQRQIEAEIKASRRSRKA